MTVLARVLATGDSFAIAESWLQCGITGKSKAKLMAPSGKMTAIIKADKPVSGMAVGGKISFNDLHPRHPAGHPMGGKFMSKGGKDYISAVAKSTGKTTAQVKDAIKSDGGEGKLFGRSKQGKFFDKRAGVVGKAQKVIKDKNATPEQRQKAKDTIAKAAYATREQKGLEQKGKLPTSINKLVDKEVERRLKNAGFSPSKVKSTLAELDPKDIAVDPKRFQYKLIGEHTKTGEVGSLSGVNKYDENLGGILQVWKDPKDGKTYVVNGHNRLALANKLGAEKVAVRYLEVDKPEDARAIGAMTNIAEGRGNSMDAAKFFRDTKLTRKDLEAKGIPMREKIASDGLALASLDDTLFRKTIDGEIPLERASIIGGSGLNHEKQKSLAELISKKKNVNNDVLSELIDTVKSSGQKEEQQFDLFGSDTKVQDLAVQKASLQANIKSRLGREKKLFGTVSKSTSAKELERGGNSINTEESGRIASETDQVLRAFDQLKNFKGSVSDLLNQAAERVANGENAKKIQDEIYGKVRDAVKTEFDRTFGKRKS